MRDWPPIVRALAERTQDGKSKKASRRRCPQSQLGNRVAIEHKEDLGPPRRCPEGDVGREETLQHNEGAPESAGGFLAWKAGRMFWYQGRHCRSASVWARRAASGLTGSGIGPDQWAGSFGQVPALLTRPSPPLTPAPPLGPGNAPAPTREARGCRRPGA